MTLPPIVPGSVRRLGLATSMALVVASMIGVGVFTTSGFALADLGRRDLVLAAWLAGGILAMLGALSYGALARGIPESGGEYTFLSRTVHPLAGFLAGWISLTAGFTAPMAAAALGLQAYLAGFFAPSLAPEWIGTTALVAAALMHGLRLREGVVLQNLAVAIKLLLLTGFVVLGLAHVPATASTAADPTAVPFDGGAFAVTLVWVSFSYAGWNAAVYVGGEVRSPKRNLARSLVLATAAVTVVYLALNAVFLYAAPPGELAGKADVAAIAAEALGGPGLRRAVSAVIALALFTSISSMMMTGPRVFARMADDGLFPRQFGTRGEVPRAAILLQTGLAIAVVWSSGLAQLLSYIGFTLGVSAAATVAGLVLIRRREGAARWPAPGYPWVPGTFVIFTLAIAGYMASRRPIEALVGVLTVAAGIPLYWLMRSRPGPRAPAGTV